MLQDPVEVRRLLVDQLLKECTDQKLLGGGTKNAIETAKKALKLAISEPRLIPPWPQLAAYRLGHLRMRNKNLTIKDLQEINKLFEEASEDSLGPLPFLYRLAVLSRLRSASNNQFEMDQLNLTIRKVYANAQSLIGSSEKRVIYSDSVRKQDAEYNLLEFASYFLGIDYNPSNIWEKNQLDPCREGAWKIIGRDISPILMTEDLARCEFKSRVSGLKLQTSSDHFLVIEITRKTSKCGLLHNFPDKMIKLSVDYARLLLKVVENPSFGNDELSQFIYGHKQDEKYRQLKSRTRKKVLSILNQPDDYEVLDENCKLNDQINILGLVDKMRYEMRS